MKVKFHDHGRTAKCPPDPAYPHGMDVDLSNGAVDTCSVALPYPAPRCGVMSIYCNLCDQFVAVTVAGRPDDPRSVKLACKVAACPPSVKESTSS